MSTLQRKTPMQRGKTKLRPVAKRKPTRVYAIEDGVQTFPDGRQSCLPSAAGMRAYDSRTWEMAKRQGYACAICGRAFTYELKPTFDHQAGRTAGNLDERIEVDGKWQNAALCWICNGQKGSRKYHWVDGKYVER